MGQVPSLEASQSPEEVQKRADRRKRIAHELFTTEQTYVASLLGVVELYIVPLTESCKGNKPILPAADIKKIFSLWQSILEFQSKVFLQEFSVRTQQWSRKTTIGDVFIKHGDLLRTYVLYVTNYDQSMELLVSLPKKNKAFEQFLQEVKKSPRHTQMDLSGYLIQPIQRIPRYVLLLSDLLKFTEPSHPDYPLLEEALAKVQKIAKDINETKREDENMRKIVAIQRSIEGNFKEPSLPAASSASYSASWSVLSLFSSASSDEADPTKPLKTGTLWKQGGGFKSWKKRHFVLFYHRIEYYEDEKMTTLKGTIDIEPNCRLLDEKEQKEKGLHVANERRICLYTTDRTYIFRHEKFDVLETSEWEKAIGKVIASSVKVQKQAEDPKQSIGLTMGKTYYCFLFNDVVVYTSAKPKNVYHLKGESYFSSSYQIRRVEGSPDTIQIENEQFVVHFNVASPAEAEAWVADLTRIVDELAKEEKVREDVAKGNDWSVWKSVSSFFS